MANPDSSAYGQLLKDRIQISNRNLFNTTNANANLARVQEAIIKMHCQHINKHMIVLLGH